MTRGDLIRELVTKRMFIVDEILTDGVRAHRQGFRAPEDQNFPNGSFELVLHMDGPEQREFSQHKCHECGSDEITASNYNSANDEMYQDVSCDQCGARRVEVFTLTKVYVPGERILFQREIAS